MVVLFCASCATVPPDRPNPADVRKSLHELSRADQVRTERPLPDDLDALVLRADHEFLACGGEKVGTMYQAVLSKNTNHIRANLGMGEWLMLHARYEDSIPYLQKVIGLANKKSPEYNHAVAVLRYVQYELMTH